MLNFIKNKNHGNIILIYHSSFDENDMERDKFIENVTPDNIITQINFLKNFYNIVPLDYLFSKECGENNMAITFDDCYENLFTMILPELVKMKIYSTIFLIGNSFDDKIFWREKIFCGWGKQIAWKRTLFAEHDVLILSKLSRVIKNV